MRTHVEFKSTAFPADLGEETEPNSDPWGKRLAEFLAPQLQQHGLRTDQIYPEDWGWAIPLPNDKFKMWIGCGRYQEYHDGYLVFIEPSTPTVTRFLFQKIDTTADVSRVSEALGEILNSHSGIRDVRWWSEDEH
jgi:hypothetical protein